LAGYIDPGVTRYDHVGFGLVLQAMPDDKPAADGAKPAGDTKPEEVKKEESKKEESKKPKIGKMKTREGDSTKLMDLLDEAKNRTMDIFRERMKEEEDADGVKSKV